MLYIKQAQNALESSYQGPFGPQKMDWLMKERLVFPESNNLGFTSLNKTKNCFFFFSSNKLAEALVAENGSASSSYVGGKNLLRLNGNV